MSKKEFRVRSRRQQGWMWVDDDYINGYAKYLDPYATAIYLSLCRHVDKNGKCFPSIKRLSEQHNISSKTTKRKIQLLVEHNLVAKEEGGRKDDGTFRHNTYWVTDKTEWKNYQGTEVPMDNDQGTLSPDPGDSVSTDQGTEVPHKYTHTKYTHKKKEDSGESTIKVQPKKKKIDELISMFEPVNPSVSKLYGNKTERASLKGLVEKYGVSKIAGLIEALPDINSQKYAPVITTPYELEVKLGKLKVFLEREKNNKQGVSVI